MFEELVPVETVTDVRTALKSVAFFMVGTGITEDRSRG